MKNHKISYLAFEHEKMIKSALRLIEDYTCVEFVERTNQEDFITFQDYRACFSLLGRSGGEQPISLSRVGCMTRGTIQHEVMHALGYNYKFDTFC